MDSYEKRRRSKEVECPVDFCGALPSYPCVNVVGWATSPHTSRVNYWEKTNEPDPRT